MWRSTQTLKRRCLLPECVRFQWYMHRCSLIYVHKESNTFPASIFHDTHRCWYHDVRISCPKSENKFGKQRQDAHLHHQANMTFTVPIYMKRTINPYTYIVCVWVCVYVCVCVCVIIYCTEF